MTQIGDLIGDVANKLTQDHINVGDVHIIPLDQANGITPKDGEVSRNKFFVVLGFDASGDVIGGLVINSKINQRLSTLITDYYLPVTVQQCPFLSHPSFINCSVLIRANRSKFNSTTFRGVISDEELMDQIITTVVESPTVNKKTLKDFGILE